MSVLSRVIGLSVLATIILFNVSAFGGDAGDSIFPVDLTDQTRLEVIYEHTDRDVKTTSGPTYVNKVKSDALYMRFHTAVGKTASFDFDIGGLNPDGGDYDYYVGAGIRYLVYDTEAFRLASFAQAHYSPIEANDSAIRTDYDFITVDAGVLLNYKLNIQDQVMIMPYAGPVLSLVRLDGDLKWDTVDANGNSTWVRDDFDAEEDNILGMVVGTTVKLRENHSMRIEARLFDNWNISAAAGVAF